MNGTAVFLMMLIASALVGLACWAVHEKTGSALCEFIAWFALGIIAGVIILL